MFKLLYPLGNNLEEPKLCCKFWTQTLLYSLFFM